MLRFGQAARRGSLGHPWCRTVTEHHHIMINKKKARLVWSHRTRTHDWAEQTLVQCSPRDAMSAFSRFFSSTTTRESKSQPGGMNTRQIGGALVGGGLIAYIAHSTWERYKKKVEVARLVEQAESYLEKRRYKEAKLLFERAAALGNTESMRILGDMHYYGYTRPFTTSVFDSGDYTSALKSTDCGCESYTSSTGQMLFRDVEKAVGWWKLAAERGDNTRAMHSLASVHLEGGSFALDVESATVWLERAAELGDPAAMCRLAQMFEEGIVVPPDAAKAVYWWRRAANNTDIKGAASNSASGNSSKDYKGDVGAMLRLGELYKRGGDNLSKDESLALYWWKRAATSTTRSGNAPAESEAMFLLGQLYMDKDSACHHTEKGLRWWTKAAQSGNDKAMLSLGLHYSPLTEDPSNHEERQGQHEEHLSIEFQLLDSADDGTKDSTETAKQKARNASGSSSAIEEQETIEEEQNAETIHLGKNAHTAAQWLQQAADKYNADALYHLGELYFAGQGEEFPYDKSKAINLWKRAAALHHADAAYSLALVYLEGNGAEQDYPEATAWLEKAAALGDIKSMYHLGILYYDGKGVKQDLVKAVRLFDTAAELKKQG